MSGAHRGSSPLLTGAATGGFVGVGGAGGAIVVVVGGTVVVVVVVLVVVLVVLVTLASEGTRCGG